MAVILTRRRSGGGSGSYVNLLIVNEAAIGSKNNLNRVFRTAYNYVAGTLSVYYNGQKLVKGNDYKERGSNVFKLVYVKPYGEDSLVVGYQILNN